MSFTFHQGGFERGGHEVYYFLDGFSNYHQIMIALNDKYKTSFIVN
jgi:hypothetical protein